MKIIFLGTNGWYSTELGSTPSILIDADEGYFILDAGEGLYKVDKYIKDDKKPIYLFISHFHLDHIYGFHLLVKFNFGQGITIIGKKGIKGLVDLIINAPFTKGYKELSYKVDILEIDEGGHRDPIPYNALLLPHPDPSMGYRFNLEDRVITYCTDTGPHPNVLDLASESDLLIAECAFLPGETDESWPHMNPVTVAEAAAKSKTKRLILTHFTANRYDTIEKRIDAEKRAQEIFENTKAAYDGMVVEL